MYKISAPLMNATINEKDREEYLRQIKKADISRVFLVPSVDIENGVVTDLDALRDNLAFFEENQIEGAVWVGETVGHGGLLHDSKTAEKKIRMTELVDFSGEVRPNTRCPLDTQFQENITKVFKSVATSGAKLILIDDDFRLSQHGDGLCCLCELHMEKIQNILGERISREELKAKALSGKPNRYRDAFLKANGDSLRELARVVREAVNTVDRAIGLALCSCHCIWDIDGTDPIELTEILKGDHAPVLRLHGAPYWSVRGNYKLPVVMEMARMFASFCQGLGYELMNEGDAYPRPRYYIPSAHVELHDAIMRADASTSGILKYMFDYVSSPYYEKGYIERHCRNLPMLKQTEKAFEKGEQEGVRIVIRPHLIKDTDLDITGANAKSPFPSAGILLGSCGIPTTYLGKGICRAVFGENINDISDSDLDGGLILDAVSAYILTERGIDVGLKDNTEVLKKSFKKTKFTHIGACDLSERALILHAEASLLCADIKDSATPLIYGEGAGEKNTLLYRYENAKGQRFLVYMIDGTDLPRDTGLVYGYLLQRYFSEGVEWASGKKLPASCEGHPALYIMCKRDGDKLTVGLFNCFEDEIFTPEVKLDKTYRSVEFINTSGRLNGDSVTLEDIPAFSYVIFTVK